MSSEPRGTLPEESRTRPILRRGGELLALPLIGLVRFYQLVISPLTPPTCRYYPSCSAYALTSLRRFGPIKGTWLAIRRVLRCHPWAPGGVDHVPERASHTSSGDLEAPERDQVGRDELDPGTKAPPLLRSLERPTSPADKGLS